MKCAIAATVAAGLWLTAGCGGSQPPPTERMTSAQASIRAARELGADQVPKAQLHLQLAEEQVRRADKLMDEGKNDHADVMLQRADTDARLAMALTRQASAANALRESAYEMNQGGTP